ncbi:MAG: aminodeoxychorismate/anthranilate synthase component II [Gammaproteobacteria bacterium]|nr:MAG: aminodeoxychorismate/anthranilate synthase component II [Gammaproteobacteria bacterium]
MVLIIDNYDSFTYNLVQYLGELGAEVQVFRNDRITLDGIRRLRPCQLVISPGPCTPDEAGISLEAARTLGCEMPVLGVCLGHQSIGQAFGGQIVHAGRPMHGKTSMIHHDGRSVFSGLENPFEATRYHSLVVQRGTLPSCLEESAWSIEEAGMPGEIMGLRHRSLPVEGVQFHPESILTPLGRALLRNFLERTA